MEAETTQTAAELLRDYAWLMILGVMLVIVIFRFASGAIHWDRKSKGEDRHSSRKDPDSLPNLAPFLKRTRIQVILASVAIVIFTVVAIVNSL